MNTQKELKTIYQEELKKVWNEKMVKFCLKTTAYIIEFHGKLFTIEKPTIKKNFCFGAGYNGTTNDEEWDAANEMVNVATSDESYFISENLKEINHWLKTLNEIKEEMGHKWAKNNYPRFIIETGPSYYKQPADCKLRYFCVTDTLRDKRRGDLCEDVELINSLIVGYEEVKKQFEKRLANYLRRYGLSKINAWSYISD